MSPLTAPHQLLRYLLPLAPQGTHRQRLESVACERVSVRQDRNVAVFREDRLGRFEVHLIGIRHLRSSETAGPLPVDAGAWEVEPNADGGWNVTVLDTEGREYHDHAASLYAVDRIEVLPLT